MVAINTGNYTAGKPLIAERSAAYSIWMRIGLLGLEKCSLLVCINTGSEGFLEGFSLQCQLLKVSNCMFAEIGLLISK